MQEDTNVEYEAQTVGEILRNTRIKQGKTLRAAADELYIRRTYLEAIENMDLQNIPAAPYGIGFIRSYAEYLGLNSERIISSYRQTVHGMMEQNKNPQEKNVETSGPKWHHILWGILGLAALAYTWTQWPLSEKSEVAADFETTLETTPIPEPVIIDETEVTAETEKDEALVEEPASSEEQKTLIEPETSDSSTTKINEPEPTAEPTSVAKVEMRFSGSSWIELRQNGKVVLSRTMRAGDKYMIEDAENATITVGRHQNVKFYVNEKEVKIVTALRRKNVALKNFINAKNQE
ncbi:MAG: helix-turn-helix domain-containing protein [Alphaproteobacteria bacterium]|nr:helix-turn-helix domain-containing protein [Alphaproteobacteria bacterium]